MKKFITLLTFFLFTIVSFSQTYLDVKPGYGTLNDAIAKNQGSVVYRLQAGQWYGLTGIIQNSNFKLTIIGTTPSNSKTMPAMIQVGSDANGIPFSNMFSVFQDLTLKNVFITDANSNNIQAGKALISMQATAKITIDSVVVDPLSVTNALIDCGSSKKPVIYITNSMFIHSGQQVDPNDGRFIDIKGDPTNGYDTLYIENNSFLYTGTWFVANENFNTGRDNFVWINHNTFIAHKSQLQWDWYINDEYFTNNLLFDFNTQPWNINWNSYFPDGTAKIGGKESKFSLITADTLFTTDANGNVVRESFPSVRKSFVEYNLDYTNPKILDIPAWGNDPAHTKNNDGKTPIDYSYLMPLVQPKDSMAVSREARMFNSPTNFPGFKYGNTLTNVDPQFNLKKIYALSDSLAAWTFPAAEIHSWGFDPANVMPVAQWPKFWYYPDSSGLGNPTAWPRFDATYSNSKVLTSSIEGLPLGDLNWFPKAKAVWQAHKKEIMDHILAENVSKMNIGVKETAVSSSNAAASLGPSNVLDNNPNTFWASIPHLNADAEEWIYLDQGMSKTVAQIVLVPRAVADTVVYCFPQAFKIQYSSDASTWTDVPGQSYTNYPNPKNNKGEVFTFSSPVNSRYIRIDATKLRVDDSGINYYFQLAEINLYSSVTAVDRAKNEVVKTFSLSQNYPNPFNPTTTISYSIAKQGLVTLNVYNMLGQRVATLVDKLQNAGEYSVNFDASKLASGVYLYRIQSGNFSLTKKMILMK